MDDLKDIINKKIAFQRVVKVINNTAGPDNLILTLFIFGVYLNMYNMYLLALSTIQRATTIDKAKNKI